MTSSTPRNNILTINSHTPRRLCRRSLAVQDNADSTPAGLETPSRSKRRPSKEKCNEISNLLTVAVRVRPMNNRELNCTSIYDTINVNTNEITVKVVPPGNAGVGLSHSFQYDHIFYSSDSENVQYASQKDVFVGIGEPMLDSAFRGYNACLFAYGQTGSGKSYSMMGEHCNIDTQDNDKAGIIPRFCYGLFERIAELPKTTTTSVEISYFELYNEKIFDLLATPAPALDKRTPLKVREHPVWGPYIVNLSPHTVKSYSEIRDLLHIGNKYRATAATVMNEKSSRSHSIVSIELSICELDNEGADSSRRSKISLVDLAGSERMGNSNSTDDRHREGVSINQSLLTLGKVISALADPKRTHNFIPYRESTLTWLLRESLGGNSLTTMLATITPASSHVDETLATLRYACQARSIVNRAFVNENPHDRLIRELRAEVERLRALRQDYERHSITPLTNSNDNDNSCQELEDLRLRLSETEEKLKQAQKAWEQTYLQTKEQQMQELVETEKRKAELESHVRIMSILNQDLHLSPYKSNFLEELEDVLEADNIDENNEDLGNIVSVIQDTRTWCKTHNINFNFTFDSKINKIIVRDAINNTYAVCSWNHLTTRYEYNNEPQNFLNDLDWNKDKKNKGIYKTSIHKHWQQIRNATNALQPIIQDDENLKSAYIQFNAALQNFESALNKSKFRSRHGKTVKFQT